MNGAFAINTYNPGEIAKRAQVIVNGILDTASFLRDITKVEDRSDLWELAFPNTASDQERGVSGGEIVFQVLPAALGGDQNIPVRSVLNCIAVSKPALHIVGKERDRLKKQRLSKNVRVVGVSQRPIAYEHPHLTGAPVVIGGSKTIRHTGKLPIQPGDTVYAKFPAFGTTQRRYVMETAALTPANLKDEIMHDENLAALVETDAFHRYWSDMIEIFNVAAVAKLGALATPEVRAILLGAESTVPGVREAQANQITADISHMSERARQSPYDIPHSNQVRAMIAGMLKSDIVKDRFVEVTFPVAGMFMGTLSARILGVAMTPSMTITLPDKTSVTQLDVMLHPPTRNPINAALMCNGRKTV